MSGDSVKVIIGILILFIVVATGVLITLLVSSGDIASNQAKINRLTLQIKELNDRNAMNNQTIAERADYLNSLLEEIGNTTQKLNETKEKVRLKQQEFVDIQNYHKWNMIMAYICAGLSISADAGLVVYDLMERSKIAELREKISDLNESIVDLNYRIIQSKRHYLDIILLKSYTKLEIRKTLIYQASDDGFFLARLRKKVCNNYNIYVEITTTTNYVFGVILRNAWECKGNSTYDKKAITFSLDHVAKTNIINASMAVKDNINYFLCIGDGDITITEDKVGHIIPGKNYAIPEPHIPETFYHPTYDFIPKDVMVFTWSLFN